MSVPSLTSAAQLDRALDMLVRRREQLERAVPGPDRSLRIARLYDIEARLWSVLFENAGFRLYWRAALAAEAHARCHAAYWRRRVASEVAAASVQVGAPIDGEWLVDSPALVEA